MRAKVVLYIATSMRPRAAASMVLLPAPEKPPAAAPLLIRQSRSVYPLNAEIAFPGMNFRGYVRHHA